MAESFGFSTAASSTLIGREHEVAIDDDAHREAGPDRDRRLDVEVTSNDLLPGLVQAVAAAAPESSHDAIVVVGGAEFCADAKHCRESSRSEQSAPMMVDPVLQAGKALRVGDGLAFQHN